MVHAARLALVTLLLLLFGQACSDRASSGAGSSGASAAAPSSTEEPPRASAAASASAGASAAPTNSARAEAPRAPPFLFSTRLGGKTSYLFGTMHLGADAEKELHPVVFEKLDSARVVVFEADAFDVDPFEALELAKLPPGQTVHDKLGPGRWEKLVDRVGGILMPESTLRQFKPWFLVSLLIQDMLPRTEPMDGVLFARAKRAGKEIVFLETIKEQIKMIEGAMDVKLLDDTLGDLPLAEKMLGDLATAYKSGDVDALTRLSFDPVEMKKHPAMFESLLFERNRRWVPKLAPLLERGDVFVAVGAAHLLGNKSVQALLVKKGYESARVAAP